jgi:CBS domain-containing protein
MTIRVDRTVQSLMQGLQTKVLPGQRPVIVATPDDPLSKAEEFFASYRVHHLPVVRGLEEPVLVGIVSTLDLVNYYAKHKSAGHAESKISDVMVEAPQTIAPHTTIKAVIQVFGQANFQSLPVVDASGHCVGIVTPRDILEALAQDLTGD